MLEEKADVFVSGLLDEVLRMPGLNVFLVLHRVLGMLTFGQKVNGKANKPGSECDLNCRVRPARSIDRRCTKGVVVEASRVTMLRWSFASQVAYILNIRGDDVAHSPVAIAYLLVTENGATVFIDEAKMSTEVEAEMKVRQGLKCLSTSLLEIIWRPNGKS